MSKHWKPAGPKPQLRPSRIRRDPVRLAPVRELSKAEIEKAEARTREREVWGGVAGVVLFAVGITALALGIGAATFSDYDPAAAAAQAARFGQCYNSPGPNCVLDGGTIYVRGQKVVIADIDAPAIQGARCEAERATGIAAAVRLADLLNSGKVSLGRTVTDAEGRAVRKVLVNGEDVAATLVDAGLAREPGDDSESWCASPSD